VTFEKSLWSQDPAAGTPARVDRMLIAQLWDEGVLSAAALKVTQRAAGANFSVDVAPGSIIITGDDQTNQGNYLAKCTALENVAISAAPGSNSRYDIVVVRHCDSNAGSVGTSAGQTTATLADFTSGISVIAGTAAASPTVPAVPNTCALIAVIGPITSGTAAITNALIHDATTGTGPAEAANARRPAGRRDDVGTSKVWTGPAALVPSGWLLEYGQAVSRTAHPDLHALYAAAGYPYGAGDGSSTFNLRDMRGRTPVGLDNMGGTDAGLLAVSNTLGGTGGAATHTLSTAELPVHTHPIDHDHPSVNVKAAGSDVPVGGVTAAAGGDVSVIGAGINLTVDLPSYTGTSGNAGSGTAHNNMQPFMLSNWIVRT